MLDFTPVFTRAITLGEFCATWGQDDLRRQTNELIDAMLAVLADCTDADVTFVAQDPTAEGGVGWSAAHAIVHATASGEEAAFMAAEAARGVSWDGHRSRYETPWESVTSVAGCRQRLEESRRMRLASLALWPDQPHLENTIELPFLPGPLNPIARFTLGLMHDTIHLAQLREIIHQASAARV